MRTNVWEFEMYLPGMMKYTTTIIPKYLVRGTYSQVHIFVFFAVAPDADHLTQTPTLTLTRTLWGDLFSLR